ncbi:hypothetical protein KR032_009167 [Drosophila birchii]|nr:hypothetical protein KR032_009167 [Drosophila birchii]
MALSRKEIIAVLLLITAVSSTCLAISDPVNLYRYRPQVLNVMNASYFANIVYFHSSYEQVAHQVVSVSTAYLCLIYAMSTWLYHSNYQRSRQEMRYVLATMLAIMIMGNCLSVYFFRQKLAYEKLAKCTDLRLMFTSISNAGRMISVILSIVCILLLFLALMMVLYKICKQRIKKDKPESA